MNPSILGVIGPGFLYQVPTLSIPHLQQALWTTDCRFPSSTLSPFSFWAPRLKPANSREKGTLVIDVPLGKQSLKMYGAMYSTVYPTLLESFGNLCGPSRPKRYRQPSMRP